MRVFLALAFSFFAAAVSVAEDEKWRAPFDYAAELPEMVAPFEPFRIIGNVYYVGTEGLAVYLIAGVDGGHALIDGGLPGYEQIIIDNIAKLGFDIKDVKYLLNTHAHFDHSGGLAALKKASGAELIASEGDVSALEGGFYLGSEDNPNFAVPPVTVDEIIEDRGPDALPYLVLVVRGPATQYGVDVQLLGSRLTSGHSRGCTTWALQSVNENGESYEVLFFCSATVAANSLVPEQYEGIVDDYRMTFDKTKEWDPDVFLSNHPEVFFMKETREKQKAGDPLAFVNRGAFQKYIAAKERAFEKALAEQTEAAENK